jgi:hypothetical protein
MLFFPFLIICFLSNLSNSLFSQCQSGDCVNGFGVYEFSNGDVYKGNWLNGVKNGYGEYYWISGNVYKGNYHNDEQSGQGTVFFQNGDVQISNYENGIETNQISYTWGSRKPTICTGDCFNGFGKRIYANAVYEGNWMNGEESGKGKMDWTNGNSYDGFWQNGKKNGFGVMVFGNGKKYEGEFVDGKREGRGTFYYLDGDRYSGDWKQGNRTGKGEHFFKNGDYYIGEWLNDKMQGRGKYIYSSGKIDEGVFENGKLSSSMNIKNTSNSNSTSSFEKNNINNSSIAGSNAIVVHGINIGTWKFIDNRDNDKCGICEKPCAKLKSSNEIENEKNKRIENARYLAPNSFSNADWFREEHYKNIEYQKTNREYWKHEYESPEEAVLKLNWKISNEIELYDFPYQYWNPDYNFFYVGRFCSEEHLIRAKKIIKAKISEKKVNQEKNDKSSYVNSSNTQRAPSPPNQHGKEGNCSHCKGTGLCSSCNKTEKKSFLDERCAHQQRSEIKLGYLICTTCKGFGYFTTNLNCNCPNGVGWCYEKDCNMSNCSDGWVPCSNCNYNGNGTNLGKCMNCKGTGNRK